jgi:non-specific serine/threonine protein kinase
LSVFPGGWTLETAEEVCSGNGIDRESIIDLLSHLVDKSLVQIDDTHGDRRYRFLETVRQYGRERLLRAGDAERMRDRHRDFFLAFVQRAEPGLVRAEQVKWLNRFQVEYDNLRSALDWCLEDPRPGTKALELTAVLWWFWIKHGYLGEGRQWLERALAVDNEASLALRAKAAFGLSLTTFFLGDYPATATSVKLSLVLSREANDQGLVALSLGLQGYLAMENGDVPGMIHLANEGRAAAIASGELWRQGPSLSCLAHAALSEGNLDQACLLTEEALDAFRQTGDKWGMGQHICDLALFCALDGRYSETQTICVEGITIFSELGDRLGGSYCIGTLAAVYSVQGQGERAVRLWGALEGALESIGSRVQNIYHDFRDRYVYSLKESLGEDAFHAALTQGRAMSFAQAIQYALQKHSTEI